MTQDPVKCSKCGKIHPRSELELTFLRPDAILAIPKEQRAEKVKETDDLCAIDLKRFFVRALLPLPVAGWEVPYNIGAWVELSKKTFDRIRELWTDPNQRQERPFSAKLANDIPSHAPTCGLAVKLQLTSPTTRPEIIVPPSKHSLHIEQCQGISPHRAAEYTSFVRV